MLDGAEMGWLLLFSSFVIVVVVVGFFFCVCVCVCVFYMFVCVRACVWLCV